MYLFLPLRGPKSQYMLHASGKRDDKKRAKKDDRRKRKESSKAAKDASKDASSVSATSSASSIDTDGESVAAEASEGAASEVLAGPASSGADDDAGCILYGLAYFCNVPDQSYAPPSSHHHRCLVVAALLTLLPLGHRVRRGAIQMAMLLLSWQPLFEMYRPLLKSTLTSVRRVWHRAHRCSGSCIRECVRECVFSPCAAPSVQTQSTSSTFPSIGSVRSQRPSCARSSRRSRRRRRRRRCRWRSGTVCAHGHSLARSTLETLTHPMCLGSLLRDLSATASARAHRGSLRRVPALFLRARTRTHTHSLCSCLTHTVGAASPRSAAAAAAGDDATTAHRSSR
mgnify:CR=1 FL=1